MGAKHAACEECHAASLRPLPVDPSLSLFARLAQNLYRMMEKRRSRRALLELAGEQLKDIGVSRADAHREGSRPFWE